MNLVYFGEYPKFLDLCYCLNMPYTQAEARAELLGLLESDERDVAWLARKVDRSYLWVWRRLHEKTRIQMEDYRLLKSAFTPNLAH